jgi:hypothetical protein
MYFGVFFVNVYEYYFCIGREFNQLWKWGRDGKKVEIHCP